MNISHLRPSQIMEKAYEGLLACEHHSVSNFHRDTSGLVGGSSILRNLSTCAAQAIAGRAFADREGKSRGNRADYLNWDRSDFFRFESAINAIAGGNAFFLLKYCNVPLPESAVCRQAVPVAPAPEYSSYSVKFRTWMLDAIAELQKIEAVDCKLMPMKHEYKVKKYTKSFRIRKFQVILLILCHYNCLGQFEKEQVYLHLDKYECWAGDSIYFRAYVNNRGMRSSLSTNLHVDLWTENGLLRYRGLFPIFSGISVGNIRVPDSLLTGNYILRAFTTQQTNFDTSNFFMVPLAVYNKDKPSKPPHKIRIMPVNTAATVNLRNMRANATRYKDSIAVLLDMDTSCATRKFTVIHPFTSDSGEFAQVILTPTHASRYVVFKIDTSKEVENILIKEDSVLISRIYLNLKEVKRDALVKINADTLDHSAGGYNSWEVNVLDTLQWISSASVTPADRSVSCPINIYSLTESRAERLLPSMAKLDTSLITITARVRKKYSNKIIKDPFSRTIAVTGIKDTTYLFLRNVEQDDNGTFKLDSLLFYGKIKMQFRLNKREDGSNDNIKIELNRERLPTFDTIFYQESWYDDSSNTSVDTVYRDSEILKYELAKVKTLQSVIVKHYKSPREELDSRYAEGPLLEPMAFSFDVRTETRFNNISDFLRQQFGGQFNGGYASNDTPKDLHGEPIMFYLDGQLQPWWMIFDIDFKRLAYIKGGTLTGFQETPFERFQMGQDVASRFTYDSGGKKGGFGVPVSNDPYVIGIYTRKGNDWRSMPSDVNSLVVTGYDEPWKFGQDRITLFWNPLIVGNRFRMSFKNNQEIKGFRVVVEGINQKGEVVHHEQIIQ